VIHRSWISRIGTGFRKWSFVRPERRADDEARILQDPQVLHHAEPSHLELGLELGERTAVPLEQTVEQVAASRIGECPEDVVVVHVPIIGD